MVQLALKRVLLPTASLRGSEHAAMQLCTWRDSTEAGGAAVAVCVARAMLHEGPLRSSSSEIKAAMASQR